MLGSTVVLDACVLYPAPLRDLLMHFALVDLYRARWTEEIHAEWIRSVLENRPDLTYDQLNRTRCLMNEHVRDCIVEDYQEIIPGLSLPDENDRHLLAAAIRCDADFILTFNLRDFPDKDLERFGIASLHPDEMVSSLIDADESSARVAATRHFRSLTRPKLSIEAYLAAIRSQGLIKSERLLRVLMENEQ